MVLKRTSGTFELLFQNFPLSVALVGLQSNYYNGEMGGRECYHCKQWIEEGEEHDCWTTTEAALTQDL
jgi:hypothetical protein